VAWARKRRAISYGPVPRWCWARGGSIACRPLAEELGLGAESIVQTDVMHLDQVQALVARAIKSHGRIDVMLNNAGVMPLSAAGDAARR
jgi:NADP-dependent 3-hydroxy acid dehydrogenase YdfG